MSSLVGKTLGSYHILEKIGVGECATVHKAYQAILDRYVAIKVFSTYHVNDYSRYIERFVREAQTVAKLKHPHILPVFDFGNQDNWAYIVMEYISGWNPGRASETQPGNTVT